jgi:hypothetical protein
MVLVFMLLKHLHLPKNDSIHLGINGALSLLMKNNVKLNEMENKKVQFETFRDLTQAYSVSEMKKSEPSYINFLSYRKFKVTIESIEESKEIYLQRLNAMLDVATGYNNRQRIKDEIKRLTT